MEPLKLEIAWEKASSSLDSEIAGRHKNSFETNYFRLLKAYNVVSGRENFYNKIINHDQTVLLRYNEEIGEEQFYERVENAKKESSKKKREIRGLLKKTIKRFPSEIKEAEKIISKVGRAAYDLSNWNPEFSDCEITGVCSCDGLKPPYDYGCIEDKSLILKSPEKERERISGISKVMMDWQDRFG